MLTGYRSGVPFVSVPSSILKDIHEILNIKKDSVVYDLGCGDGRILFHSASRVPEAQYIGIENRPLPLMLARISSWWQNKNNKTKVQILNKDFFDHDLSKATHVIAYLYPNVMDDLLTKFDRELAPGTLLISVSFRFTQKQPKATFDLSRGKYSLARELYLYEF